MGFNSGFKGLTIIQYVVYSMLCNFKLPLYSLSESEIRLRKRLHSYGVLPTSDCCTFGKRSPSPHLAS